jgi:hypothetical protein
MDFISKKKLKKVLMQIKKSKKCLRGWNKTLKKTAPLKRCHDFCKNDYLVELNRVEKEDLQTFNPSYKPTKEANLQKYKSCKRIFCNEGCKCYDSPSDKLRIQNGFQKEYSAKKIKAFKKRGALSACMNIIDYDVFHR